MEEKRPGRKPRFKPMPRAEVQAEPIQEKEYLHPLIDPAILGVLDLDEELREAFYVCQTDAEAAVVDPGNSAFLEAKMASEQNLVEIIASKGLARSLQKPNE